MRVQDGDTRHQRKRDGYCQYRKIVFEAVAAIVVAGAQEIVEKELGRRLRDVGLYTADIVLPEDEQKQVNEKIGV